METVLDSFTIQTKHLPAVRVAVVHFNGSYQDIGTAMSTLFSEAKGKAAGPPFCIYHTEGNSENREIDAALPLKGAITQNQTRIMELPAIDALYTTHVGKYEDLHIAYKAIADYAKNNGMELLLPWREVYIKGPGMVFKGNPKKYITEIQIPYK